MRSETVFLAIFDDFDKIGRFLGVFGRKRGKFGANYVWFFADIAPRPRAASPSGKNPPIYTVLNAAFSAPGPPRLWHRGGTPVPDALPRAPDAHFAIFDKIENFEKR